MANEYWTEYWTDEVEEAVGKYGTCSDVDERNKIFTKYLHQAFQKLIDDIIKRYRPDRDGHEDKDVKLDLLSILVEHIERYNPAIAVSRGYKPNARIYCSVIIKSAIVDRRVKSYKERKNVQISEIFLKDIN
jgi:hypothetical protein